jgi:uncharacterized protein
MIRIAGLALPLSYDEEMLKRSAAARLHLDPGSLGDIRLDKRTIDKTDKQDIHFNAAVLTGISGNEDEVVYALKDKTVSRVTEPGYAIPAGIRLNKRPVVVGCGPAGLFAALILAQAGTRPILLERGLDVDLRAGKVMAFWQTGVLDPRTNVQFGEGGAGTFSDGKLKIGKKDARKMKVLHELVEAGAPPEIMYAGMPHVGTDRLRETVKRLREKIILLGGEVHFGATVTDILQQGGRVRGVRFRTGQAAGSVLPECREAVPPEPGKQEVRELCSDHVILAIGHSARDTFARLYEGGLRMEQKAFALGLRIEHPQEIINKIQYGDFAGHPALGAAAYKMVVHLKNGRNVYTFCMCPGGSVVSASSEENRLTTNGMSRFARDGANANSALLVTVGGSDLGSDHPLEGIAFQRRMEEAAFAAGGGGYTAPVQRLEDFLQRRKTRSFGAVLPSYLPGTSFSEVDAYLPGPIADSLRQAIIEMDEWMPGFAYPDALLTGAETRSSSPLRMTRGDSLEATGIEGLYPCGEGAGYSGGIISAAVDGMLCAERILKIPC